MPDVDMTSLVSSEVTTTTTATTSTISSVMIKNEYSDVLQPEVKPVVQQLSTREQANGRAKMTLGQMALAGIVISSGPGDHFETYEGNFFLPPKNDLKVLKHFLSFDEIF